MKALLIGGTSQISMAVTRKLLKDGWEVCLLNRGNRTVEPEKNLHFIQADINDEDAVRKAIDGQYFDCVCEWIGYKTEHMERDYRLFRDHTDQYLFTSSAAVYQRPPTDYRITEGMGLANPYSPYAQNKLACEQFLMDKYRREGFPVTIIRPSHTYDERHLPFAVRGKKGFWQIIKRMMEEKPVIIHGDGTSLWTLTFNEDFAVGYTGLMGCRRAVGEAFHITSDEVLTWNQIYETIAQALHVPLHPVHVSSDLLAATDPMFDFTGALLGDKSYSSVFDNSKLKQIVPQMTTTVPFHKGVRIALDYILSHPECQIEDPEFDAYCDRIIAAIESLKNSLA